MTDIQTKAIPAPNMFSLPAWSQTPLIRCFWSVISFCPSKSYCCYEIILWLDSPCGSDPSQPQPTRCRVSTCLVAHLLFFLKRTVRLPGNEALLDKSSRMFSVPHMTHYTSGISPPLPLPHPRSRQTRSSSGIQSIAVCFHY